ncbi:MAG: dihydropteroate synthase [Saccharofermentans sp.]|nr:dihydropteroate synthase [Saccharofermentans sp.]
MKQLISPDGRFVGTYKARDRELVIGRKTLVMGIVNVTPDSFSDGGEYYDTDKAVAHALELIEQGADVIDIGGESTRPGYEPVGDEEEIGRVVPVIRRLAGESSCIISCDTSKAPVARAALEAGCHIINDVTALRDPDMADVVAEFDSGCIIMYNRRLDKNINNGMNTSYQAIQFLKERIKLAEDAGIKPDHIMTDPGIGFGTTRLEDLALTASIMQCGFEGKYPVLYGVSRKRIAKVLSGGEGIDNVSIGLALAGVSSGCAMVRVHNVRDTVQALMGYDAQLYAFNGDLNG